MLARAHRDFVSPLAAELPNVNNDEQPLALAQADVEASDQVASDTHEKALVVYKAPLNVSSDEEPLLDTSNASEVDCDDSDSEDEWRIDVTEADLQHAKDMMPENVRRHP